MSMIIISLAIVLILLLSAFLLYTVGLDRIAIIDAVCAEAMVILVVLLSLLFVGCGREESKHPPPQGPVPGTLIIILDCENETEESGAQCPSNIEDKGE